MMAPSSKAEKSKVFSSGPKDFDNVGVGEIVQIIVNRGNNSSELLRRLAKIGVQKMIVAFPGVGIPSIFERLQTLQERFQDGLVLENLEQMMHRGNQIQKTKELDSSSDVCVGLRLEEPFVFGPGGERGRGIDDDGRIGRPGNRRIRKKVEAGRMEANLPLRDPVWSAGAASRFRDHIFWPSGQGFRDRCPFHRNRGRPSPVRVERPNGEGH